MTKYLNCFIYEIVHIPTGKVYIGSSCNKYRWIQHKNDKNSKFSKFIREEGVSNFKFNRLYNYPCSSLIEKIQEEQRVMDTINNSMLLNTIRAYTSTEQKKERMKELTKQWINNNRTKWNEYQKNWRKNSKIKKLPND